MKNYIFVILLPILMALVNVAVCYLIIIAKKEKSQYQQFKKENKSTITPINYVLKNHKQLYIFQTVVVLAIFLVLNFVILNSPNQTYYDMYGNEYNNRDDIVYYDNDGNKYILDSNQYKLINVDTNENTEFYYLDLDGYVVTIDEPSTYSTTLLEVSYDIDNDSFYMWTNAVYWDKNGNMIYHDSKNVSFVVNDAKNYDLLKQGKMPYIEGKTAGESITLP